jgi:hypothetical protein
MDNLKLYEAIRQVPEEAQKPIQGGRLKGMTDINPMWRIKTLTEQFGVCGIGWYYEILQEKIEEGANDEKVALVKIALYIKQGNEWSKPIIGTGGSMFVAKERGGLYTSDEAFKMALTDAISVSCKALGMGADIYWQGDRTKYDGRPKSDNNDKSYYAIKSKYELIVNKKIRDWKKGDFDNWYKNQQEKYKPQQIDTFLTKILREEQ